MQIELMVTDTVEVLLVPERPLDKSVLDVLAKATAPVSVSQTSRGLSFRYPLDEGTFVSKQQANGGLPAHR